MRFVGYTGSRPPVADVDTVPDPVDPPPTPTPPPDPVVLEFADGDVFHRNDYLLLGYNRFDVMCIGAAGGFGGWYRQTHPNGGIRQYFGGAPGGGGAHRVTGRLALLPSLVPVVVGGEGGDGGGLDLVYPTGPATLLPGGDGGHSAFGTVCKASGGKGGLGFNHASFHEGTGFPKPAGGAGGIGNSIVAGGGAPAENNGIFIDSTGIGKGGGGGGGGGYSGFGHPPGAGVDWLTEQLFTAGSGGEGNSDDSGLITGNAHMHTGVSVNHGVIMYGGTPPGEYGDDRYWVLGNSIMDILPGAGGGAKPYPVNYENVEYGSRGAAHFGGRVAIRLYRA